MHRKNNQDSKRAKLFTKIIREITVAAKLGAPDPDKNPRLRSAIIAARDANMPKENVERAIRKGSGNDVDSNFQEIHYEGYGPKGVAVIVEALSDNRNRTAAEVRSAFSKAGGALGEHGSVLFLFEHIGVVSYKTAQIQEIGLNFDAMFEAALEVGAKDVVNEDDAIIVISEAEQLHTVREGLGEILKSKSKSVIEPASCELIWRPQDYKEVSDEDALTVLKFIETLEDNDDIQKVFSNHQFSDAFIEKNL